MSDQADGNGKGTTKRAPRQRRPSQKAIDAPPSVVATLPEAEDEAGRRSREVQKELEQLVLDRQARDLPQHNRTIDLNGCYIIEEKALVALDTQFARISGVPLKWSFELDGDRSIRANTLAELLEQPVVGTRPILNISARCSGHAPGLTEVSLRVSADHGVKLDIESRDTNALAGIESAFADAMRSSRHWLSFVHSGWLTAAVLPALSFLAAYFAFAKTGGQPNDVRSSLVWIAIVLAAITSYSALVWTRRLLVPRAQFDIGRSSRDIAARKTALRVIAGFIVVFLGGSILEQLWVKFWLP